VSGIAKFIGAVGVIVPNFVTICRTVAEIWHFIEVLNACLYQPKEYLVVFIT